MHSEMFLGHCCSGIVCICVTISVGWTSRSGMLSHRLPLRVRFLNVCSPCDIHSHFHGLGSRCGCQVGRASEAQMPCCRQRWGWPGQTFEDVTPALTFSLARKHSYLRCMNIISCLKEARDHCEALVCFFKPGEICWTGGADLKGFCLPEMKGLWRSGTSVKSTSHFGTLTLNDSVAWRVPSSSDWPWLLAVWCRLCLDPLVLLTWPVLICQGLLLSDPLCPLDVDFWDWELVCGATLDGDALI